VRRSQCNKLFSTWAVRSTDWMTDWLTGWLNDRLIDRTNDWRWDFFFVLTLTRRKLVIISISWKCVLREGFDRNFMRGIWAIIVLITVLLIRLRNASIDYLIPPHLEFFLNFLLLLRSYKLIRKCRSNVTLYMHIFCSDFLLYNPFRFFYP